MPQDTREEDGPDHGPDRDDAGELPQSNPRKKPFTPEILDKTVIAIPLLERLRKERGRRKRPAKPEVYPVIIDVNLEYTGRTVGGEDYATGRMAAKAQVRRLVKLAVEARGSGAPQGLNESKSELSPQYYFGRLEGPVIEELVRLDGARRGDGDEAPVGAIYRIWPDFEVRTLITRSVSTVKADAARSAFSAQGEGVLWAVMDSGIDGAHPHFAKHDNLMLGPDAPSRDSAILHRDFTALDAASESPLTDAFGHGTHVAGIIAGETAGTAEKPVRAVTRLRDERGNITYDVTSLPAVAGMAPRCRLLSLKVLDDAGDGLASNLIAAIAYIQEINGHGRRIRIHGVNMSVGYDFEPEWFACGQSPLCVEVNRLVRSGVVVVVAAGNTGYGWTQSQAKGAVAAGQDLTINDPGNAELAITVGSTHRDMPHIYGVSYFSSKGPTGDGRLKPDLVAPGEKILSCAAGQRREEIRKKLKGKADDCEYREESGTSMAAPHVSGVVACFLSIRGEFIGNPEAVKEIFLSTATDLKRDRYFQGRGLVDLMRAIQSV